MGPLALQRHIGHPLIYVLLARSRAAHGCTGEATIPATYTGVDVWSDALPRASGKPVDNNLVVRQDMA